MKSHVKSLRIVAIAGMVALTAVSLAFAAQPVNSASDKTGTTSGAYQDGSKSTVYPGSKPEAGKRDDGNVKSTAQPAGSAKARPWIRRVFPVKARSPTYTLAASPRRAKGTAATSNPLCNL
ncbi:exported hypothetical protein [uncultured delta proteobacterium]|uniref:Uncharacterized protein n=1 Tax=uncultured delta proteobacterium TaxID=34034 RepID=A0A212JFA3_9DELT|nr:exported hypothetical protein [uncultured delta proteobacterium]